MPKYEVEIDLSGRWSTTVTAESASDAAQLAINEFEEDHAESILDCIEPAHPDLSDVFVYCETD